MKIFFYNLATVIQRIQTVFLLLAAGFLMPLYYVSVGAASPVRGSISYFVFGLVDEEHAQLMLVTYPPFILLILLNLSIFVAILLFRNLSHQAVACRYLILGTAAEQAVLLYYHSRLAHIYPDYGMEMQVWIFLPLVVVFFIVLALRAIRKDIALRKVQ